MSLKDLLGEDLYNQVIEKVGNSKLAIVSDGNWIPKDKFDAINTEKNDLKQQISDRDKQLDDLSKQVKDNQELTNEINRLKDENKTATEELQGKLEKQAFDFALESALRDAKAKNPKAVRALLNTEAIKLVDGQLIGFEDQVKNLRESDDYLFVPDGLKGKTPSGSPPTPKYDKNPFSKEHFNLTEQARIFKEDPDLYKQLKAQA